MKSRITYKQSLLYAFLATSLLLGMGQVHAQSISRQVIGSTGGEIQLPDASISWAVGESFVGKTTGRQDKFMATVGFQQPSLFFLPSHQDEDSLISIAPNPTQDIIIVTHLDPTQEQLSLSLTNVNGQVLIPNLLLQPWKNEIDISSFPAGTYFLQLQDKEKAVSRGYKIIKY